ncbi:MAG: formimidoylglutamate deiminase [Pyrinomonadaceae bacterium]
MKFQFKAILQNDGWLENALVETDPNGRIVSVGADAQGKADELIDGFALPGFQNAHSHAFQYAMAGLAENHRPGNFRDDFWSWREAMYSLALSIDPEQLEATAAMLYAEMLRHGYTNVAEFHYLHHDRDGTLYSDRAEMSSRLIAAARRTGIGITLIPIFYQKGGFGTGPEPKQKRFISATPEEYQRLFEAAADACRSYENANIGMGIHSLRGVEPELIKEVVDSLPADLPFHIHISEQLKEIEDCLSHLGKKPVQWMLDNAELSDRFHFVHATHVDDYEVKGLAESGVNVVLCPTTEGNLGDGIFPLGKFQDRGGSWSIGTDSHVSLNPFEELRLLDYGQRLVSHRRNIFADRAEGNSGINAIRRATLTGRRAMNDQSQGFFEVGRPFNASVISAGHPLLQTASPENRLNTIIYSSDETWQTGTIAFGIWRSKNGRHQLQERITGDFLEAVKELGNR